MTKGSCWTCCLLLVWMFFAAVANTLSAEIDQETGLIVAPGFEEVKNICTICHSPMLITQNKADRDGWLEMIRWMQDKQGLRQLEPELEKAILDYLAANYGPVAASRRPPLEVKFPE